jgi:hypothetical protein
MRAVCLCALLALGAACHSGVERLTLVEPEQRLLRERGQQVRLVAVAENRAGAAIATPQLRWSSDSPEVASVDDGTVTALKSGRAVIRASTMRRQAASCSGL